MRVRKTFSQMERDILGRIGHRICQPNNIILRPHLNSKWVVMNPNEDRTPITLAEIKEKYKIKTCERIKKRTYHEKINSLYRDINDSWTYQNKRYQSCDNFNDDNYINLLNRDLPKHKIYVEGFENGIDAFIAYKNGKLYYAAWMGGYDKLMLYDIYTHLVCNRFTSIKTCAPVKCIETDKYI